MSNLYKSTSFVNETKHSSKSDRFQVVKPEYMEEVLKDHGFNMVYLKTGKSRVEDKKDFQTTIARYRNESNPLQTRDKSNMDIIIKAPHIYGSIELVLGLFRGVCSNQLNFGKRFNVVKIAHVGNPIEEINRRIPELVMQQNQLLSQIEKMQNTILDESQRLEFARDAALLRLEGNNKIEQIDFKKLLTAWRLDDASMQQNLYTTFNIVQENLMRVGVNYVEQKTNAETNVIELTQKRSRRIKDNSYVALDLNGKLWDKALDLVG